MNRSGLFKYLDDDGHILPEYKTNPLDPAVRAEWMTTFHLDGPLQRKRAAEEATRNARWLMNESVWKLDPQTRCLVGDNGAYEIELSRIAELGSFGDGGLFGFVNHLMGKTWAIPTIGDFVRAAYVVFHYNYRRTLTPEQIPNRIAEIMREAA